MKIGSLFTGYGGLDLALAPHETAWVSDISLHAKKLLAHRFPSAPNLGDITEINWANVEPVEIITGGWPCQPFSRAGQRKGAGDERALWPEVERAIRGIRPRYVFLENVAAIAERSTGPELGRATAGLAQLGYVGSWLCLRASDVGAPHQRARIFIVAADADRVNEARGCPAPVDIFALPHRLDKGPRKGLEGTLARWAAMTRPMPKLIDAAGLPAVEFVEWVMGLPAGWVSEVPKLSASGAMHLLGNGVVPQQARRAIEIMRPELLITEKEASK